MRYLTVALAKGRLAKKAMEYFERIGYPCEEMKDKDTRKLIFTNEELRKLFDISIFVDADADDRLIRVMKRDVIERGRTAEAVIERYQRVLKPMHEQFIEPCKRFADVIVPQGGHNNAAINMLAKFVKQQLTDK